MLTVILGLQALKTLDDLEIAKAADFHNLPQIRLELDAASVSASGSTTMSGSINHDGRKWHSVLTFPNGIRFEQIDNGVTTWYIDDSQKRYYATLDANDPPFDPKKAVITVEPGNVQFNTSGTDSMQFGASPPAKITSVQTVHDGDDTLRKVVIRGTGPNDGIISLTQWFLKDRWVPRRFELTIDSQSGRSQIFGMASIFDLHPIFAVTEFVLDPKRVSGYQKANGPPPAKSGNASGSANARL